MTVTQWLEAQHGIKTTPGENRTCPGCGEEKFTIDANDEWALCGNKDYGIDFLGQDSTFIKQLLGKDARVITLADTDDFRLKDREARKSTWSQKKAEAAKTWSPLIELWETLKLSGFSSTVRLTAVTIGFVLDRNTGRGWITEEDIARATGFHASTVQEAVKLLTEGSKNVLLQRPKPYTDKKGKIRFTWEKYYGDVLPVFKKGKRMSSGNNILNTYTLIRRAHSQHAEEQPAEDRHSEEGEKAM